MIVNSITPYLLQHRLYSISNITPKTSESQDHEYGVLRKTTFTIFNHVIRKKK